MTPPATEGSATRRFLKRLGPWLVSFAILAFLFARVPREALITSLKSGPLLPLAAYTAVQVLLVLMADACATAVSLAVVGIRQRFFLIFLARGATYILGILNYALGQGALGLYLQRSGVPAMRAAGIMVFLMVVNLGVILFVASLALLMGGYPETVRINLSPLAYGLPVGLLLYLAVIALPPRWLRNYRLLTPLLEAGLRGHLRAAAGRLPHVLLLVITHWGALRLWGIQVPLAQGVAMVSLVLLIVALPITPVGLGTSQAALVFLFSPYVPLPSPEARAAAVLAFSLVYYFLGVVSQALIGFWCWLRLRQRGFQGDMRAS